MGFVLFMLGWIIVIVGSMAVGQTVQPGGSNHFQPTVSTHSTYVFKTSEAVA